MFTFLSWKVRHYRGSKKRMKTVVDTIKLFDPEPHVFGLLEFEAKTAVRDLMTVHFPDYDFGMTDTQGGMELLVGWKRGFFDQVIYSQRRRFQRTKHLRPGGLVSVRKDGTWYNLLFLHMDSGTGKQDYKN